MLVAIPDIFEGLDLRNVLVIPDTDEPREPECKSAIIRLADLQFSVPYFEDECGFKSDLFSRFRGHSIL